MVHRPVDVNSFEFAVVASLRARQLIRGCTPRVVSADATKVTVTAQMEVAERKVAAVEQIAVVSL